MFTGIVEEAGTVAQIICESSQRRLSVKASRVLEGLQMGDSVAVNGCCLTAVEMGDDSIRFDLLEETLARTALGALEVGDRVNLERSLRFDGRIGGHFVSGHIDALGKIVELEEKNGDRRVAITVSPALMRYVVDKGCVAIDGVSLTVTGVEAECFSVWLIPHTLEKTNLGQRQSGDAVNLEFDLLAKYVESLTLRRQ